MKRVLIIGNAGSGKSKLAALERHGEGKQVVVLRSRGNVRRFLAPPV